MLKKIAINRHVLCMAILILFIGFHAPLQSNHLAVNALTAEEISCQAETKQQGKQYNDNFKMASYYSQKTKTCYFSFAESLGTSKVSSGIRKKDASGNISVFFQYVGSSINRESSGMTILSIAETIQGDIVIGGSVWTPAKDLNFAGYYAVLSASGMSKAEHLSGGQSIEKVYADDQEIVLAGSMKYGLGTSSVVPHLLTIGLDGSKLSEKTYSELTGQWFADVKTYKSKYYRVSPADYNTTGSTSTQPVKWIDKETLKFADEQMVKTLDKTTFTSHGSITIEGNEIVVYSQDNRPSKRIPYTSGSNLRTLPLPTERDNSIILAEIGSTIKLTEISDKGQNIKSVDTNIFVASDELLDFKKLSNGETIVQKIAPKGEETIVKLDLSEFNQKDTEDHTESETAKDKPRVPATEPTSEKNIIQEYAPFIIGGIASVVLLTLMSLLFLKKKKSSKNKISKLQRPINNTSELIQNAENYYGFSGESNNNQGYTEYTEHQVYEEQPYTTYDMNNNQGYTEYTEHQVYEEQPYTTYDMNNNQGYTEYTEHQVYEEQPHTTYDMNNNQGYTEYTEQQVYEEQPYTTYDMNNNQGYTEYTEQQVYEEQPYTEYEEYEYQIDEKVRE